MKQSAALPAPVYEITAVVGGFAILRNDRHLMTPAGKAFVLPTEGLAAAIADEWRGQTGTKPNHAAMPLNQLACTALDIVPAKRAVIIEELARYAAAELLCHRAAEPPSLIERQKAAWQPLLDWVARQFDAPLKTGTGIMPIRQNIAPLAALRQTVMAYDDFGLAGLQQAVGVAGSLVLGLALAERQIDAMTAFTAAELEASHQIERWGEDPASEARRAGVQRDLSTCEQWFGLIKT